MRVVLAAALAAMALATPVLARAAGNETVQRSPGVEANTVTPSRAMVGQKIWYRRENRPVGTVQDVVTGSDGQPMAAVKLADGTRTVLLGSWDLDRRGNRVIMMHDPAEVATLPTWTGQTSAGGSETR